VLPLHGNAQEKTMTVEELEAYIAEKKAALVKAQENREMTQKQAAEIREALAAKQAQEVELKAEMEELCTERNEVDPGSYDVCMAQLSD
jgi:RNA-splicing ligase RtcB